MIVFGSAQEINVIIWKVCRYELEYNETICENLDKEEYDDIQTEVQRFESYIWNNKINITNIQTQED